MMANMQPGNGQMQQQAQPHYMPHMGQQPQQQMNSSYQMPPLNRSMSAGYMMTGGNQMMQQNMMQGQQGMPQMHQMDMNQVKEVVKRSNFSSFMFGNHTFTIRAE